MDIKENFEKKKINFLKSKIYNDVLDFVGKTTHLRKILLFNKTKELNPNDRKEFFINNILLNKNRI